MLVVFLLIFISLTLAVTFLAAFIWAVKSGQYEDTCTPSMRILTDSEVGTARCAVRAAERRNDNDKARAFVPPAWTRDRRTPVAAITTSSNQTPNT
jgi:cbb3-type cytochrome oxidase maturation protein